MRILIIPSSYPDEVHKESYSFVHARAKIYLKNNHLVKVFIPSNQLSRRYSFENVEILQESYNYLRRAVDLFDPDIVAVHSPSASMARHLHGLLADKPIITWIHGIETLFTLFHHYYPPWELKSKIRSLLWDPLKIAVIRRFIDRSTAVVYVSKWMKKMTEFYTQNRHPFAFTIPNPVDTDIFRPFEKSTETQIKGISVRSLGWKYGLDIAVRAYSRLEETNLTIIGSGSLSNYIRKLIREYEANVCLKEKTLPHGKMPEIFAEYGYFVAPSRTEAQGVAMCEAMACGLPVIATKVGGIPEFVTNEVNGLLVPPENPIQVRKAIKRLISDHRIYETLSKNAASFTRKRLSHEKVYRDEYSVFKLVRDMA